MTRSRSDPASSFIRSPCDGCRNSEMLGASAFLQTLLGMFGFMTMNKSPVLPYLGFLIALRQLRGALRKSPSGRAKFGFRDPGRTLYVLVSAAISVVAPTSVAIAQRDRPLVVMPGIASTRDSTEIRMAFSPDGKRRLWGRIAKDNPRGFQIVESVYRSTGWAPPVEVSFNSDVNDFDPSFAPDGRSVLFFSNRAGGAGGDDIWSVPFDHATGQYGTPANLGRTINTARDEFAPALSADGRRLLFSSNGRGGRGGQDLFISARRRDGSWGEPRNLGPGVNGPADDFDATFIGENVLVYTSGDAENGPTALFRARRTGNTFVGHERLKAPFNCSKDFNLGPSRNPREPHLLYYSAGCPGIGLGRADIFSAPLGQ